MLHDMCAHNVLRVLQSPVRQVSLPSSAMLTCCVHRRCLDVLVKSSLEEHSEVMIATHNQKSIERAVALMYELGIEPFQAGVYFGQLLGMADHLTFILGRNGYRVSLHCLSWD